jgi:hypothetical protein
MIFSGFLWPDITVLWMFRVAKRVKSKKYDRILVSVLPRSPLLLAWLKRADSSWVFEFQEPVSEKQPGFRRTPISKWLLPLFIQLQRKVLSRSEFVVFATRSYIKDYVSTGLVREDQVVYIPFFYDDHLIGSNLSPPREKCIISYFGVFSVDEDDTAPDLNYNINGWYRVFVDLLGMAAVGAVVKGHICWQLAKD